MRWGKQPLDLCGSADSVQVSYLHKIQCSLEASQPGPPPSHQTVSGVPMGLACSTEGKIENGHYCEGGEATEEVRAAAELSTHSCHLQTDQPNQA